MRAWMRLAFYAFWALFLAAQLLGAFASNDPLIRLACRIAIPTLLAALLLVPRLSSAPLRRLCVAVWLFNVPMFILLAVITFSFGGGALNGRVDRGSCYLVEHGIETSATCRIYYTIAVLEMIVFTTWPVGFALAFSNASRRSSSS